MHWPSTTVILHDIEGITLIATAALTAIQQVAIKALQVKAAIHDQDIAEMKTK